MYEDQTFDTIMTRLLNNVPSKIDKSEGSFIYDALAPAAIELTQAYIALESNLLLSFAETSYGPYLDYRAAEHGLTRKEATKAVGIVTISGTNGTTVPAGTLFSTGAGILFQTTGEVSIGETGQADTTVEAVLAGTSGNVASTVITQIPVSIPGVVGAANANPTSGGTDEESDTALLGRLLEKVRLPSTSGNTAHYKQWAKEVPGVGNAKVFPLWNGNGTVKVIIITNDMLPAGQELVDNVAAHIESLHPIGAMVTVSAALEVLNNVSATITLAAGYVLNDVKNDFAEKLGEYFAQVAFNQTYISFAQVGSILFNTPGVVDYNDLLLNGGTVNVDLGAEGVPVVGTITLTV